MSDFTSWNESYLEHYGIPGMKWGVRRYQNKDGTLTERGKKYYSLSGKGRSAKRMAKDFNKLDQSYANVEARRRSNAFTASKYSKKSIRAMAKGNEAKSKKLREKAIKYGVKAGQFNKNKRDIEALQWKIIGHAARKGYTINSEEVKRYGQDGKTRAARILGGPLGSAIYSYKKHGRNTSAIDGQNVSISRRGNGGSKLINYNAVKSEGVQKILQKQHDEEIAERYKNKRR